MPTNEERRAAAKEKLERQLQEQAAKARRQRVLAIIGAVVAVVVVAAAAVTAFVLTGKDSEDTAGQDGPAAEATETTTETTAVAAGPGGLPAFDPPGTPGENCQYPAAGQAAKKNTPPRTGKVPTDEKQISVSMHTNQGNIGLMLDNEKSPCTVNSFASLAQQGYFDDTVCHRLTASPSLGVLQCGDPTGTGTGGPGYQFANEYPTNQYRPDDPKLAEPVTYPRGTVAMANAGPGTNGSQFFLVYRDSQLPPNYTVFGTIDETGLATLDQIAQAGIQDGAQDGKPAKEVRISTIRLDL
ncbi:peptidylprolyl isomerase [uncultured Mycolicibacterium sp.]|uniref:peptidylprolyl isomerase n=1 Tax=uncultured Mycolicibacterium sp. TaxID=2320817 RepID=UPI00260F1BDD|nr:peptidylprolyl isomerase [uncultured Mycolicibacterium sp.]